MPKYVKTTDVINTLSLFYNFTDDERYELALAISTVPTANVAEVKHGKWIYEGIRGRFPACKCSVCGSIENADWAVAPNGANFCPSCGADMRE